MKVFIYDVETIINCFTLCAVSIDGTETKQFVIHESRNDTLELIAWLKDPELRLIGYNNIGFDYPVIHQLLIRHPEYYMRRSAQGVVDLLYQKAQQLIGLQNEGKRGQYLKPLIPQRDLFLVWHFDNKAKQTSLKWVQCAIQWINVEDSPFRHNEPVTESDIDLLLSYNMNDVLSTKAFYEKSHEKIMMRYSLSQKYGIDLLNANDPKIGEMIILKKMSDVTGAHIQDIKQWRTSKSLIYGEECMLPYIKFETKEFQALHNKLKKLRIDVTKKEEDITVIFDGMEYQFGYGGIHAARPGLFKNIDSADVSSYYPNLSIRNKFHPRHLGLEFCEVYEGIYDERKKYPKGSSENAGLKLSLNGAYGKSNSEYSFLYDPKFTMQITFNGQLLLAMLCEKITISKAGRIIMANTDGLEVEVYDQQKYKEITDWWQELTSLELEFARYKVIAVRDVNNYIAIKEDGKTKEKGAYEVDKEIHKDPSMRIVPYAVREHFKTGKPVEDIIREHNNLWDFFLFGRAKTGRFLYRFIDPETSEEVLRPAPKTIRYYVSSINYVLMKETEKKFEKVHQNEWITPANYVNDDVLSHMERSLDRQFYIREARKLLAPVENQRVLQLFN